MESKPGRSQEPPAKRVGPLGLCFEYTALRNMEGEPAGVAGALWKGVCSLTRVWVGTTLFLTDSELGGCPRPFRKRYALKGVGAGTSAIRQWRVG